MWNITVITNRDDGTAIINVHAVRGYGNMLDILQMYAATPVQYIFVARSGRK